VFDKALHNAAPGKVRMASCDDEVRWLRPAEALAAVDRGELAMWPPTLATLAELAGCADVAGRNNAGTSVPNPGYAQTNTSAANPNAIEVRTRDKDGANEDADFHLIVVCP